MQPRVLLDTHVLFRWLLESSKLSKEQASVLDRAVRRTEPIAISAMSLLEIAILAGEGRLKIKLKEFFDDLQANPVFRIFPLTPEIALEVAALGNGLRDPADRTIVATARVHRLTLITSDQRIIASKLVTVID